MKISSENLADLQIKKLALRLAEVELNLAIANIYVDMNLPKDARIDMTTGEIELLNTSIISDDIDKFQDVEYQARLRHFSDKKI